MKTTAFIGIAAALLLASCKNTKNEFDASGAFETEETIISAEASGTMKQFDIAEGQQLKAGQAIGYIDTVQLYLKKKQLEAQIGATLSRKPNIPAQLASLQEQLKAAQKEQQRITSLLKADAATPKQLDDINAQIDVIRKQIDAQQSALGISSQSITEETLPVQVQIEQLDDQLAKSHIINPLNGTVLAKYAEANEVAAIGKPLYKIADLSTLTLRAYISGDQLPQVKLNQKVKVLTDDGKGGYRENEGTISWISDKAEFTPKTIQTKDERADMVYAIKVLVKNDGSLKIGMYAEIKFLK